MNRRLLCLPLLFTLMFCTPKAQESKTSDAPALETVFHFPKKMKEISGIQLSPDGKELYAHEDQGNSNEIYVFNLKGDLLRTVTIDGVENNDWEDITKDKDGFTYIGDFGNNDNERRNLAIYKVKIDEKTNTPVLQTTKFSYPEQTEFPPKKSNMLFDCEAFVEMDGNFYLFTKNRSKNFDSTSLIYKVPNKEGEFKAQLLGTFKPGGNYNSAAITGADLSPDGKRIALVSHKNVFMLENFAGGDFSKYTFTKIPLHHESQKEGICFVNDHELLLADERKEKPDGNLYRLKLK